MNSTLILVMNVYAIAAIIIGTFTYNTAKPDFKKCILWLLWVVFVGFILFLEMQSLLTK